nr:putative transposase (putative), gypsy type [Tanacetum cinerariifolium]
MGRDTVQLETAVNTISHEYLLDFTLEYDIPETLHPALPVPEDRIVDFPEGKIGVYTRVFSTVVDWRTNVPKDGMPAEGTYSLEAVRVLDTHHVDLFNLIRAPNPTKVKTGSRPRAPHEVLLLTLTAPCVIEMDESATTDSSGIPSTIERSPLYFAHEAGASDQGAAALEMPSSEDVPATVAPGMLLWASVTQIRYPLPTLRHATPLTLPSLPQEWGVTNGSLLDTLEACQDLVDHVAPPGYFFELRHMHNEEFRRQYNVNLARQVAMGSQLRLRFEQEAKLLRKSVAQVARRDKRIQARELEIRNLEASLKAEENAKRAAEGKSAGLSKELERMRAQFSDLQDERVEQRCAEMDARLDALSIDFDEELYPHMLTAIAGRRWVIGRGLRLAVMKCGESLELRQAFADAVSAGNAKVLSEGLKHGLEHGQAQRSLESIEAYDPEAKAKFLDALLALKDLKYPLVDQLEGLRDAPMDVIMAALFLEKVRDPWNPWAYKEEIGLADAIAENISHAEKKKRCRIVCRTHRVGSAHHVRSDGIPMSAPTVVPQDLALLLVDAATQTESDDT